MSEALAPGIAKLIISSASTISKAIELMDASNRKLLIVQDGGVFKGLFSIGDVQRAIIAGVPFSEPIGPRIRSDCLFLHEGYSAEHIRALMLRDRVEYMPIVGQDGALAQVVFWEELFGDIRQPSGRLDVPVVIMAGGLGTRLKPLTNVIPKALVPVHDKPIIEDIVDRFVEQGANRFLVSVNYRGKMIRDWFEEIPDRTYTVEFFAETEPRGTAGSLALMRWLLDGTFIVTNCDIIVESDYREILEFHRSGGFVLTLVSALKPFSIPYGVVKTGPGGLLVGIDEKPDFSYQVNTGFYVIEPQVLSRLPEEGIFHMTELINALGAAGERVGVFPVNGRSWLDMGEWGELQKMGRLMLGEDRTH